MRHFKFLIPIFFLAICSIALPSSSSAVGFRMWEKENEDSALFGGEVTAVAIDPTRGFVFTAGHSGSWAFIEKRRMSDGNPVPWNIDLGTLVVHDNGRITDLDVRSDSIFIGGYVYNGTSLEGVVLQTDFSLNVLRNTFLPQNNNDIVNAISAVKQQFDKVIITGYQNTTPPTWFLKRYDPFTNTIDASYTTSSAVAVAVATEDTGGTYVAGYTIPSGLLGSFPESAHPYPEPSTAQTWTYTFPANVTSIDLTFDSQTYIENGYSSDALTIRDGSNNIVGSYTGSQLSGATINVPGKIAKLTLGTDQDGNTGWGFKVTNVTSHPTTAVTSPRWTMMRYYNTSLAPVWVQKSALAPFLGGIAIDGSYVYVAGSDNNGENNTSELRLEKRRQDNGLLCTAENCGTAFGQGGVVTNQYIAGTTHYPKAVNAIATDGIGGVYVVGWVKGFGINGGKKEWLLEKYDATNGKMIWQQIRRHTNSVYDSEIRAITLDKSISKPEIYNVGVNDAEGIKKWRIEKTAQEVKVGEVIRAVHINDLGENVKLMLSQLNPPVTSWSYSPVNVAQPIRGNDIDRLYDGFENICSGNTIITPGAPIRANDLNIISDLIEIGIEGCYTSEAYEIKKTVEGPPKDFRQLVFHWKWIGDALWIKMDGAECPSSNHPNPNFNWKKASSGRVYHVQDDNCRRTVDIHLGAGNDVVATLRAWYDPTGIGDWEWWGGEEYNISAGRAQPRPNKSILVGGKTKTQCEKAGGSVVLDTIITNQNIYFCKFSDRTSCPNAWSAYQTNGIAWTRTRKEGDNHSYCDCTTGEHNFSNVSIESCSVNSSCGRTYATVSAVGCY